MNLPFYHFFRLSSLFKIAHSLLALFSDYADRDNYSFDSILLLFCGFVDHLSLTIFTIKFIVKVISKSISEWFLSLTQSWLMIMGMDDLWRRRLRYLCVCKKSLSDSTSEYGQLSKEITGSCSPSSGSYPSSTSILLSETLAIKLADIKQL